MEFKVCIKCGWHNGKYMLHVPCKELVYTLAELRDLATNNAEVAEFLKNFHTDPKIFEALTEYFNTALSGHDYRIIPNPVTTTASTLKGDGVTEELRVCVRCNWFNDSGIRHAAICSNYRTYTIEEIRDYKVRETKPDDVEIDEFLEKLDKNPTYRLIAERLKLIPSYKKSSPKDDGVTNDREAIQENGTLPKVWAHDHTSEIRTTSSTGGQKGVKIERFDLIPIGPLTELAQHYGRGALKYESHQWRQGYEWSKSYSALQRHLTAFWAGQDYDVCPFHLHSEPQHIQESLGGCAFNEDFPCNDGHRTCYNHTGSHHMAAVAWHAFTLLEFKDRFPQHDDRYNPNGE